MKCFWLGVILSISCVFAQSADNKAPVADSSGKSNLIKNNDEELIIGDDEDIMKANQQKPSVDSVAPAKSVEVKKIDSTSKKSVDNELILDGGEENIFESVKSNSTAKSDTGTSGAKNISTPSLQNGQGSDSLATASVQIEKAPVDSSKKNVTEISVVKEQQKVEKANSINFAQNLKDYRSPKIAMLLSLFVPGAGQVYAKHNSWKAAIYGAVEVGMIATSVAIRYKGKEKEDAAHSFADEHYKYSDYLRYQNLLKSMVSDSVYQNVYIGGTDSMFKDDASQKNSSYYSTISDEAQPFVHGWDDATPGYRLPNDNTKYMSISLDDYDKQLYDNIKNQDSVYLVYPIKDSSDVRYGFSSHQREYSNKVSDANAAYRSAGLVLRLMIINHIVSAIDAGLSAKAHNDKLLKKESIWNHINLEQMYVSNGNSIIPGFALKVRF